MDPLSIISAVSMAITIVKTLSDKKTIQAITDLAQNLITVGRQLFGAEKIPTWEEILKLNDEGEEAIQAEMKKRGLIPA